MKIAFPFYLLLSLGAATCPTVVRASPLMERAVPSDVDWVVHVDVDLLRLTRSGSTFIREFSKLSPARENEQLPVDPVLIINGLRGLTAFGSIPDFQNGQEGPVDAVVMLQGTPELMQVFRGLVSGFELEQPGAIVRNPIGDYQVLTLQGEISGLFLDDERIVLGKSLPTIEEFLLVEQGQLPHLSFATRFPTYRLGADSGVFLGAFVEGMDGFENLPAQARVLQLTRSVSLQLGEVNEYLQLLASLVTDSAQTGQQVQEVLQGIIALMTITQTGQPDFAQLINSVVVSRENSMVSLRLAYPVASAEVWIARLAELAKASMEASQAGTATGSGAESTEPEGAGESATENGDGAVTDPDPVG